jgi:RND family efflux transporter MFP subunit
MEPGDKIEPGLPDLPDRSSPSWTVFGGCSPGVGGPPCRQALDDFRLPLPRQRATGCVHAMTISRFLVPTILLAAGASGCGGRDPQGAGDPRAMPPVEVRTITLAAKPVPQSSEFIASIRSLRSTTVQPQVEGIVRRIFVTAGDRVRAGQPLVQIDPEKQQASVATWQSSRVAREAEVAFAKQQLARMDTLLDAGAVSRAEFEQAQTAYQTAQAQLSALESQIRESQVELQYYRVTAPASGTVGDIPVRQGDRVTTSTPITTIDGGEGLEAYIDVPLERATGLRPGLPVELLDSAGQVAAVNPITFVAPRADDRTQSVLAKSTLRNVPPGARVEQYIRARIVWSSAPALAVPVVAVNRVSGQYFVFVAEQGQGGFVARQKPITVGEVVGEDYVVKAGLQAGQRVIVSNVQKLGDGSPVSPAGQ